MLRNAIRFQNGMVMCFDDEGHQVGRLQGLYQEVAGRVMEVADPLTVFELGDYTDGSLKVVLSGSW